MSVAFGVMAGYVSCFGLSVEPATLTDMPVKNFILPVFGEDGHKSWEIRGGSGIIVEQDLLKVQNSKIWCYSCNSGMEELFMAKSDTAMIEPHAHVASGNSTVRIFGKNFIGSADSWTFSGKKKKFTASGNIKIEFYENLREK